MLFTQEILIPAGTTQDDPVIDTMSLTWGRIDNIWMNFPAGCRGQVYVAVMHRLFQIVPVNVGDGIHLDGMMFSFRTDYDITSIPHEVYLVGWAPDTSFQHTITVLISVDVSRRITETETSQSLLAQIASLFD